MYCQSCGKRIPDESVYCMWCGKPVAGKSTEGQQSNGYPSTDEEKWYEDVMRNHVAAQMKNPTDCVWPHYSDDMRAEYGKIKKKPCLLTWIDATNDFGGKLRVAVRIKLSAYPAYSGFAIRQPRDTIFVDCR